jgi:hypothetical protein
MMVVVDDVVHGPLNLGLVAWALAVAVAVAVWVALEVEVVVVDDVVVNDGEGLCAWNMDLGLGTLDLVVWTLEFEVLIF